jgi:tetratricopeptide (TPR) repeat protein
MSRLQITKWEENILKGLFFLVPTVFILPLITISSYFFPFIVPRNTLFRILVGIALSGLTMLFVARPKQWFPYKNKVFLAFFVLISTLTVSSLINGEFLYAFWSNYERMEGLLNLFFLLVFLVILVSTYRKAIHWRFVFRFTILVSYFIAFVGWSQHVGADLLLASSGGERVSSTLGNPTYLAAYAMFHIFFAFYLFIKSKYERLHFELYVLILIDIVLLITSGKTGILQPFSDYPSLALFFILPQFLIFASRYLKNDQYHSIATKGYFIIVAILNFFVLFNTQTRGALLGLIGGTLLALVGYVFLQQGRKRMKQMALTALVVIIGTISSIFTFSETSFVKDTKALNRIASISISDNTAKTRFLNWEASYKGWKEKPILGWGEEKYSIIFNKYFPQDIYRHSGSRIWFDRPHNVVIQYFAHGGLVGGLAYLSIFMLAIVALFRYWKKTGDIATLTIFTGLLAGYTIQNVFVFDSINTSILFILTLGFIIFKSEEIEVNESVSERLVIKKPPFILAVLVILLVYSLTIPKAIANTEYIKQFVKLNLNVQQGVVNEEVIDAMEDVINKQFLGKYELRQNYTDTVRGFLSSESITSEQKLLLITSAERQMLKSIEEQPDNVRHHTFLSGLYVEASRLDPNYAVKNIELVTDAINLSPTRTHLYYAIGRSYLVAGDAEDAVGSFAKALELSPKVSDAHLNYLAALITTKQFDKAEKHLSDMKEALGRELSVLEYSRIASMFQSISDFSRAIATIEDGVGVYSENLELLQILTGYYFEVGNNESALRTAEKMVEIEPSFASQFEDLKESLGQ